MNSENINVESTVSGEISSKELIFKAKASYLYLLSQWIIIVLCILIGAGLGGVYAYFKKPIYTATTSFVLEESGSGGGLGNLGGLASMVGIDVGGGGGIFQGDNILELYKSRKMIEKALLSTVDYKGKSQLLIDRYIEFSGLRKNWIDNPKLANLSFEPKITGNLKSQDPITMRLQDSILGAIVNDIKKNSLSVIKADKKLSIIRANVKSKDEFFSKAFNDQIVKNVNDFYVQTKTKKSLENIVILQQKTDSVRAIMTGAIFRSASTLDATPNLNPTRQVLRAPVQGSQFTAETNKTILAELVKNLELSKISLRKETPLIQVIDVPIFPLEKDFLSIKKGIVFGIVIGIFLSCSMLLLIRFLRNLTKI